MPATDGRNEGFTLLEALVALAILAGTTAALLVLIATNRRVQSDADGDVWAALHARTILARVGRDLPLEVGTQSGTFEDGRTWILQVEPFRGEPGSATPQPALLQIRLRLGRSRDDASSVEVVTLKMAPR